MKYATNRFDQGSSINPSAGVNTGSNWLSPGLDNAPGEIGSSGTIIVRGIISGEEYLGDLIGKRALLVYDEMRRSDATVHASLEAVKLPLIGANWQVQPATDGEEDEDETPPPTATDVEEGVPNVDKVKVNPSNPDEEDGTSVEIGEKKQLTPEQEAAQNLNAFIADFIDDALFHQINWAAFLRELLNFLEFGYSVFEICLKVIDFKGQPLVTLDKLASRKHRTIYAWEQMSDNTPGITQWTIQKGTVYIPANKLVIFTNYKEGDNFEGVSVLRSSYQHYYYKKNAYKLQAVAAERMSLGIPHMTYEPSVSPDDRAVARELLQNMRNNEEAYIETVSGIDINILDMGKNGVLPLDGIIDHHDRQISKNVLAQFIEMGAGSNTSAFTTGASQAQLFNRGVEAVGRTIKDTIAASIINLLVQLNWPGAADPELIVEDINDEDLKTFGTTLQVLTQAGLVTPDAQTEKYIRDKLSLPEISANIEQTYEAKEKTNLKNAILGTTPVNPSSDNSAQGTDQAADTSSMPDGTGPGTSGNENGSPSESGADTSGSAEFSEKDLLRRARYLRDEIQKRYKL